MAESTRIHQQRQPSEVGRPAPGVRTAGPGVLGQNAATAPSALGQHGAAGPGALRQSLAAAPKAKTAVPHKQVLEPVTRRGRLVLAPTAVDLELETTNGRFELLGPYGTEAHEGDEVEVTGLPDPTARHPNTLPAILIQQMRRI